MFLSVKTLSSSLKSWEIFSIFHFEDLGIRGSFQIPLLPPFCRQLSGSSCVAHLVPLLMLTGNCYTAFCPVFLDPFFVESEVVMLQGYPGAPTCDVPIPVPPAPELFLLCAPYVLDVLFLKSLRAQTMTCSLQVTVLVLRSAQTKAVLTNHVLRILQPGPETP